MASPSVQLPPGMESATKSLDQQVMELSLTGNGETGPFPTTCDWYSSSFEPSKGSQNSANASSSSTYIQQMWSQDFGNQPTRDTPDQVITRSSELSNSLGGAQSDFSSRPTTRQSREGTYIMESKSEYKSSSPKVEPSFRASSLGDTMKALMDAAEAYGKQPNLQSTSEPGGKFSSGMSTLDGVSLTNGKAGDEQLKGIENFKFSDESNIPFSSNYTACAGDTEDRYDFKEKHMMASGTAPESRPISVQSKLPQKQLSAFESSDLAFRLRTTVKSSFLANELGGATSESDPAKASLRSIDEIMRDYGIVTRTPPALVSNIPPNNYTTIGTDTQGKSFTTSDSLNSGTVPLTLRKDGSQLYDGRRNFGSVNSPSSFRTTDLSRSFDPTKGISGLFDSKLTSGSESIGIMNLSQNNETAAGSSSNLGQESVRKYGSSVDFGAGGAATKNPKPSGPAPYSAYESKKSQPYGGDSGYNVTSKYSTASTIQYDGSRMSSIGSRTPSNLENGRNSEVTNQEDEAKNPEPNDKTNLPNMGPNFELISSLGSSTDALDYSMHQERQRLRNIDTIIATTPIRTQEPLHKSYSSRYVPTEYGYPFGTTDFGRRLYSSPQVGASTLSGYNSDLMHRSSWAGNLGTGSYVPMSYDSYGGSAIRNTRGSINPGGYRSSSMNRGGHNVQYNNCTYDPLLTERLIGEKNRIKESKQTQSDKKSQNLGKGQTKKSQACPTVGRNAAVKGTQKRTSNSLSNNNRYHDESRRSTIRSAPRDSITTKKAQVYSSLNNGLDFTKELAKMWQASSLGTSLTSKPKVKPVKYQPYTPQGRKEDEPEPERPKSASVYRKIFEPATCQSTVRKSQSYWAGEKSDKSCNKTFSDMSSRAPALGMLSTSFRGNGLEGNTKKVAAATRGKKRVKASKSSHPSTAVPKSILKQSSSRTASPRPNSAGPVSSGMRSSSAFHNF